MESIDREYFEKKTTANSMIFDRFRKKESLNGHWHYAVDQYNTFLRQKWFNENYYDAGGNTLPVDFSFDEWELMDPPVQLEYHRQNVHAVRGKHGLHTQIHLCKAE